jgi:hypothetical protein
MQEPLSAASKAAHKLKPQEEDDDDVVVLGDGYVEFDRVMEAGLVVAGISELCTPHLKILARIVGMLLKLHEGGTRAQQEERRQ